MQNILLVIHLFVAVAMVIVILLQRSEGGALGSLGGGSGSMGFMSARGAGNALTRLTAIFGTIFMITSILLTIISRPVVVEQKSLLDTPPAQEQSAPAEPSAPVSK